MMLLSSLGLFLPGAGQTRSLFRLRSRIGFDSIYLRLGSQSDPVTAIPPVVLADLQTRYSCISCRILKDFTKTGPISRAALACSENELRNVARIRT